MGLLPRPSQPLGVSHHSVSVLADRVGFEPTKRLPVYTLSRRVPSATRPPIPTARMRGREAAQTRTKYTGLHGFATGAPGGEPWRWSGAYDSGIPLTPSIPGDTDEQPSDQARSGADGAGAGAHLARAGGADARP